MKIKNLKCILFLLIVPVFLSVVFWDCNNTPPNDKCTDWSTFWNNKVNSGGDLDSASLVYFKMFGFEEFQCNSTGEASNAAAKVLEIQESMKQNCWFDWCLDSKFWSVTRSTLSTCASEYCSTKWGKAPILNSTGDLACSDSLYEFDNETKCCKSNACKVLYWEDKVAEPNSEWKCENWWAKDTLYNCCINVESVCGDSETWYVNLRNVTIEHTGLKCEDCWFWRKPSEDRLKCVCDSSEACCWIELYVWIPFIGDCIEMNSDSSRPDSTTVSNVSAFPILMQWLMKIVMSLILIVSFLLVIVSWLMLTAWAFKSTNWDKWKTMIKNVIISLIMLWLSWLILKLINPSFFGG